MIEGIHVVFGPRQFEYEFNIRNTRRPMPGTNIFKEQLQCNEKEWNVKNIVFDPRQLLDAYRKLLHPPTHAIFFRFPPPTLPTLFSRLA